MKKSPDQITTALYTNNKQAFTVDTKFAPNRNYRWYRDRKGYIACSYHLTGQKLGTIRLHQLIWFKATGKIIDGSNGLTLDHIDQDKTNNTLANLREATQTEQNFNRAIAKGQVSIYPGVAWHKQCNKWMARIMIEGRREYLGLFTTELDAAIAVARRFYEQYGRLYHDIKTDVKQALTLKLSLGEVN